MNKTSHTVLVIEDEPDIMELIEFNLKKYNYNVLLANNGEKGLKDARSFEPDLILLDLMLPGIQGIDVCRVIKSDENIKNTPIIILSALGQEEDIVKGLDAGADDYVSKPFSLDILNARIKSVLRRYIRNDYGDANKTIVLKGIKISPRTREVTIEGELISLTYTEFQILHLLISHPGWVFTRYQIIDKIRGENYPVTDRSIDFQIVGLRKKMLGKGNLIETIRGVGYRFQHHET
ncbi:MAG: DNA-binding response regulator [Candidatus Marinimicrobia bacterium]|nr:DNA-binding response regulator [Candidatus Neomarinimicrobiota bacterium]|tara:strand:+ start:96 stop:800 length:705 start_codon:yes stop_codon:yes gene_type:complete